MSTPTRHPHADLILQRARQDVSGETFAGWWQWELRHSGVFWGPISNVPEWTPASEYRCVMTSEHPHYVAPKLKLKLIDMAKLPKGSAVSIWTELFEVCEFLPSSQRLRVYRAGFMVDVAFSLGAARIAEQKEFTYWGGGECPVPDGVRVEVMWRMGERSTLSDEAETYAWAHGVNGGNREIIGYRILGVADDWTDDPELAK